MTTRYIDYYEYIRSPEWRSRAKACKAAAGYRCQVCNGAERLQAHHRTYDNLGHELPGDLTCLCDRCHSLVSAVMPERPWQILRMIWWYIKDVVVW
jgi:hypothetical protein